VIDRSDEGRYVIEENGSVAELVYRKLGNRLTLVHTGVPDEMSGKGVASALVEAAVGDASRQGLTVVPRCPYVRKWLREHPEAAHSVSVDWH
jgi:predicted GNAT family acetyltransferase